MLSRTSFHEPTLDEISIECEIPKEDIIYALDAIQTPLSLYDPVYTDSGDTLYVMDQISDKKNKEENWIEDLSLSSAMEQLNDRDEQIIRLRFFEGKTQIEVAQELRISQAQVSRLEKNALKSMHWPIFKPKGWKYEDTAAYGHFGREEFPWEKTNKVQALKKWAKK